MKVVTHQKRLSDGRIRCDTCAHHCLIDEGEVGQCGVRENREGMLVSLVYGRVAASHVDPVEKKPFFHFMPGARAFSLATVGCNFRCRHCQNASISQMPVDQGRLAGQYLAPEAAVQAAVAQHCRIIAYTYTEPAVYWDYARDIAKVAQDAGLANLFVTNGFWSSQGLKGMLPLMDGANVDLKAFSDETYRNYFGARLKPVLETITAMRAAGVWVEVTTLVIPGLNDSDEELQAIAQFLVSVDCEMPWHVSRFYPAYRLMDREATSTERLHRARQIGLAAGLKYVYVGNLDDENGLSTFCAECGQPVITRLGFQVKESRLVDSTCPNCHCDIPGVWASR